MGTGELVAAAVLAAAGCQRGSDLRLVASRVGVAVHLCPEAECATWLCGAIWRRGHRDYDRDQLELAGGLAAWASTRFAGIVDDRWCAAFVEAITPCKARSASGMRGAVRAEGRSSG